MMRMGRRVCRIAPLRVGFPRVGFRVGFLSRLGVAVAPVAGVLSVFFLPVWETFCNPRSSSVFVATSSSETSPLLVVFLLVVTVPGEGRKSTVVVFPSSARRRRGRL